MVGSHHNMRHCIMAAALEKLRTSLEHYNLACCQKLAFLMDMFFQDQCQDDYYHSNLSVNEIIIFSLTTDACCYLHAAADILRASARPCLLHTKDEHSGEVKVTLA